MSGKIVGIVILVIAAIAGITIYYLQVFWFPSTGSSWFRYLRMNLNRS